MRAPPRLGRRRSFRIRPRPGLTLRGVTRTPKSATPCVFCGQAGSLSKEHVVPKWLRKDLQIAEPVREFRGTAYVGEAETLAVVFHEVASGATTGGWRPWRRPRVPSWSRYSWVRRRGPRAYW